MSGIYGSTEEDRYFEGQLFDYLDELQEDNEDGEIEKDQS